MKICLHEFKYSEPIREFVCVKCGHVITKEDKKAALERAWDLMRAEDDAEAQWVAWLAPQTNADRIRAMSDEELAEKMGCPYMEDAYDECKFGWHTPTQTCFECKLEWLRQPAKGGDNDGM